MVINYESTQALSTFFLGVPFLLPVRRIPINVFNRVLVWITYCINISAMIMITLSPIYFLCPYQLVLKSSSLLIFKTKNTIDLCQIVA